MADRLTRIAIVSTDQFMAEEMPPGVQEELSSLANHFYWRICIEMTPASKATFVSEKMCIGCGICVKAGAFPREEGVESRMPEFNVSYKPQGIDSKRVCTVRQLLLHRIGKLFNIYMPGIVKPSLLFAKVYRIVKVTLSNKSFDGKISFLSSLTVSNAS